MAAVMLPDDPCSDAPLAICNAPPLDVWPCPARSVTEAPSDPPSATVLPAAIATLPPTPLSLLLCAAEMLTPPAEATLLPARMAMLPLTAPATPVDNASSPELPTKAAPLCTTTDPLGPVVAAPVSNVPEPDAPELLLPLRSSTLPPVAAALEPPASMTDDPIPPVDDPPAIDILPERSTALPLETLTVPLLPSLASPLRPRMEPELPDTSADAVEIAMRPL